MNEWQIGLVIEPDRSTTWTSFEDPDGPTMWSNF
jgi:hypothetical protein